MTSGLAGRIFANSSRKLFSGFALDEDGVISRDLAANMERLDDPQSSAEEDEHVGAATQDNLSEAGFDKGPRFTDAEDDLLVTEAVEYESTIRKREKAAKIAFWVGVRAVFADHGFEARGPANLTREDQSPYQKRWVHIRTSYTKVRALVIQSGAPLPQTQEELDQLVDRAASACYRDKKMRKLGIGFKHFHKIFTKLDGWTEWRGLDGAVDTSASPVSPDAPRSLNTSTEDDRRDTRSQTPSPRVDPDADYQTDDDTHVAGSSRKRHRPGQLLERYARRTRQSQENAVRMDTTLRDLVLRLEDVAKALETMNQARANTVQSQLDLMIRTNQAIQNPANDEFRRRLELMAQLVFDDAMRTHGTTNS